MCLALDPSQLRAASRGFDPGIRLGEDVDFFGRAMREFGTDFLDRTTLHYRIGSPSLMPQC
jgi:hypothetical protein